MCIITVNYSFLYFLRKIYYRKIFNNRIFIKKDIKRKKVEHSRPVINSGMLPVY